MKISSIVLNNFRQYYGRVVIDLETNNDKNIILVGGKNGYGKTNFLLSIVWCLYGEKITQIDESFKREVQKETNYQKFIKQSLNWKSREEGKSEFSVEIQFEDIDYPANLKVSDNRLLIKRVYNTQNIDESLSISNTEGQELFFELEDKISFINDYLIPIEAAKFVFFDAEKIASWAELSTKDEGNVLNDALGKLLGLDLFENLKDDIIVFIDNLRKESAPSNLREQIDNTEQAIKLNTRKIEEIDLKSALNDNEVQELKKKINEYQIFLNRNSKKETSTINRENLYSDILKLRERKNSIEKQFNDLSEIIPIAMLSGKIEEVIEQLEFQNQVKINTESNAEIKGKLESFIEQLFNKPPEPEDGSMSFKNKVFYSDKAQVLLNELFNVTDELNELELEFDLNKADTDLIYKASQLIKQQSKEIFETTISDFNAIQITLSEAEKQLKVLDSDLEDETILETISKKDEAERKKDKIIAENGALKVQKEKLESDNNRLNQKYTLQLQKSSGNQIIKSKISSAKKYIDSIQTFIDNQKRSKKESLASSLYIELKKLMHKLQAKESNFIEATQIEILPDGKGLLVKLIDSDGKEINKESLGAGEKQIYISCLIKAILKESIQDFPIFIDTPLGRLDHEHIENILNNYYPDLSSQVILLATNNEVTPRRYNMIAPKISKAYLIVNEDKKSYFKPGYFQSYENTNK